MSDNDSQDNELLLQVKRLEKKNSLLQQSNEYLQEKFEEMSKINQNLLDNKVIIESVRKENKQLQSENKDLNQRIQILCEKNDSLQKELESKKKPSQKLLSSDLTDLNSRINREREEFEIAIQQKDKEMQKLKGDLVQKDSDIKTLMSLLDQLKSANENFFNMNFTTTKDLIDYIKLNCNQGDDSEVKQLQELCTSQENQIQELRTLLKSEKKKRHVAEIETTQLREKISNLEIEYEIKFSDLNQKLEEAQHLNDLMKESHLNEKQQLRAKLASTQDLLEKTKNRIPSSNNEKSMSSDANLANLKSQNRELMDKLIEATNNLSNLKRENEELVDQISTFNKAKENLQTSIAQLRTENSHLREQINNQQSEIQRLKIHSSSLEEETRSATAQVLAAKATFNQTKHAFAEESAKADQLRQAVDGLKDIIASQKSEIDRYNSESSKLIGVILKQKILTEKVLSNQAESKSELKKQIKMLKEQLELEQKKNEHMASKAEEIPVTSWFCAEFPQNLIKQISDLSTNPSYKTVTKLKLVLETIAKYYNTEYKNQHNANDKINSSLKAKNNVLSEFITGIGAVLHNDKLTPDNLVRDPQIGTNAISYLNSLINELNTKSELIDEIDNASKKLFGLLGVETLQSAVKKAEKLIKSLKVASAQIDEQKAKCANERSSRKTAEAKAVAVQEQSQRDAEQKQIIISNLTNDKSRLAERLRAAETEIIQLRGELKKLQNEKEDLLNSKQLEHEDDLDSVRAEWQQKVEAAQKEADDLAAELDESLANNENLEMLNKQLRNELENLQLDCEARSKKIADLQLENEVTIQECKDNLEREKQDLTQQYEAVFESMKKKNEEQRTIIDKLTSSLAESEQRYKIAFQTNSALSEENKDYEDRLNFLKDELDREKKLRENQTKAIVLTTEMKCQSMIDEEKANSESEKRKIFAFVASQFKKFFDGRKTLDEETFKSIINGLKTDYDSVNDQLDGVRRLLGLSDDENPVDALSKLLLTMFMHK
ncbi:hypothetical protein TVAG_406070 [Trichomonas vaginalis G3]|uniref:Uncharacterized protein n=1 Tax=Trichomonas vaginalis (strain ATCC PRA-98 / G3) TaxID=412133 RepID=A2DV97_TRIV3|nr:A-type inclusion protein-related family [Trichomonas vaginalis G3]EAY15693.1 hypothetical protein TVAG_406070 [Trichomonas vaginalis G3]KAI5504574.1 A-type inclusion protein-related family [Trichomonas vaginalis G3]|eukprot:XP_001327916.1 hypothetical protein [Trichomonas vaginalis G3]